MSMTSEHFEAVHMTMNCTRILDGRVDVEYRPVTFIERHALRIGESRAWMALGDVDSRDSERGGEG
jgi:hypothetical protein